MESITRLFFHRFLCWYKALWIVDILEKIAGKGMRWKKRPATNNTSKERSNTCSFCRHLRPTCPYLCDQYQHTPVLPLSQPCDYTKEYLCITLYNVKKTDLDKMKIGQERSRLSYVNWIQEIYMSLHVFVQILHGHRLSRLLVWFGHLLLVLTFRSCMLKQGWIVQRKKHLAVLYCFVLRFVGIFCVTSF